MQARRLLLPPRRHRWYSGTVAGRRTRDESRCACQTTWHHHFNAIMLQCRGALRLSVWVCPSVHRHASAPAPWAPRPVARPAREAALQRHPLPRPPTSKRLPPSCVTALWVTRARGGGLDALSPVNLSAEGHASCAALRMIQGMGCDNRPENMLFVKTVPSLLSAEEHATACSQFAAFVSAAVCYSAEITAYSHISIAECGGSGARGELLRSVRGAAARALNGSASC